jgi:hypothetical protein
VTTTIFDIEFSRLRESSVQSDWTIDSKTFQEWKRQIFDPMVIWENFATGSKLVDERICQQNLLLSICVTMDLTRLVNNNSDIAVANNERTKIVVNKAASTLQIDELTILEDNGISEKSCDDCKRTNRIDVCFQKVCERISESALKDDQDPTAVMACKDSVGEIVIFSLLNLTSKTTRQNQVKVQECQGRVQVNWMLKTMG